MYVSYVLTSLSGSTCALVGRSGGGKSTLVNLMMRFYDPQEGTMFLDDRDIKDLCLKDVRANIGVVQQNTELFGGTIEENIVYGLEPNSWTRGQVIEAAIKACAHDFIKEFPEGYATRVGERGVRISGGQKQRIAIARIFLRKPRILLLDEVYICIYISIYIRLCLYVHLRLCIYVYLDIYIYNYIYVSTYIYLYI
jgi:ATP-binding cassette subfamily B protein